MKKFKTFFLTTIAIAISVIGCKDISDQVDIEKSTDTNTEISAVRNDKIMFAKAMSKALNNEEFRLLVKNEALKKFDNDYDVFYQSLKSKQLSNGITVEKFLSGFFIEKSDLKRVTDSNPMLTLFIPSLQHFSAEKWNVTNEIPVVGVRNIDDISDKKNMRVFSGSDEIEGISYKKEPKYPILIVKDNERLTNTSSNRYARLSSFNTEQHEPYLVNETGTFSFWDNSFDPRVTQKRSNAKVSSFGFYSTLEPEIREAFENGSSCQRDNLYYNILPALGRNTGSYRPGYQECLTSIEFGSPSMYSYVVDDFSDGQLEIQVTIAITGPSNSSVFPINKGIDVSPDELFQLETNEDGSKTALWTKEHIFYRIPIIDWNMKNYGDTWKFTLQELDPGTTTTVSNSVTSTFGTNFTSSSKDGIGFGSTSTNSFTSSFGFSVSGASDALFDGVMNYCSQIVSGTETLVIPFVGLTTVYTSGPLVETGYVNLKVLPYKIQ